MEVVAEVACGLDVHQAEIVACLVRGREKPERVEARFRATRAGREALRAWLETHGCGVVGMEASGVYWRPIHAALEEGFQVIVGNPLHMKALRGRKTDRKDARWIADLVRHGLIKGSFIPTKEVRDLRELTRQRKSMVEARSQIRNEVSKLLNSAGLPITAYVGDLFGVSGRDMLLALCRGESCAASLAALARGQMRKKIGILTEVFDQPLSRVQQAVLRLQLARHADSENRLAEIDGLIAEMMRNHREDLELLCGIPGIQGTSACYIFGELGFDPAVFPSPEQLAAWCGVCPGSNESAKKAKPSKARKGNRYIRWILTEVAKCATATLHSQFKRRYQKLVPRLGKPKATVAMAHLMARVIHSVLRTRKPYVDADAPPPTPAQRKRIVRAMSIRAAKFGYALVPVDMLKTSLQSVV